MRLWPGGRQVFSKFGFAVGGRRRALVTGPNGAGKILLLRLITGLVGVAGGGIALDGGDGEPLSAAGPLSRPPGR
jgi:ABC-type transport system involved in cytochrome c biogenesis ATPase subunit